MLLTPLQSTHFLPFSSFLVLSPSSSTSHLLHHEHRSTYYRPCGWASASTTPDPSSHHPWPHGRCHRRIRRYHFFPLLCLCGHSVGLLQSISCCVFTAIRLARRILMHRSTLSPRKIFQEWSRRSREEGADYERMTAESPISPRIPTQGQRSLHKSRKKTLPSCYI